MTIVSVGLSFAMCVVYLVPYRVVEYVLEEGLLVNACTRNRQMHFILVSGVWLLITDTLGVNSMGSWKNL